MQAFRDLLHIRFDACLIATMSCIGIGAGLATADDQVARASHSSIASGNIVGAATRRKMAQQPSGELRFQRQAVMTCVAGSPKEQAPGQQTGAQKKGLSQQQVFEPGIPASPPPAARTDLFISGVAPHLTTYGVYSQNGAHYKSGHHECGIGAIVPWAGKLWMVNYAPHMPGGSEHKLFSIDPDLSRPMTIHPESVGGTPAGRMIHEESNQLLIAHYAIDASGKIRTIQPKDMPIRVTAIARHLKDPTNLVYYIDMEGSIWEANVNTLAVKRLFKKPVPGWHGKGGYTSQGRLVITNNGELHVGDYRDVLVGGKAKNEEERGVLAEFDGTHWNIVERRQFTEVTGPSGITGGSDGNDPVWTMGWDRRSVRLKVLDDGQWHTYLLPKAAYCNDASHGWYTEWPRIREITDGRWMMDMHGMFFDFPQTFSSTNSAGIQPIGSHLRYVPDFCGWNGKLVLASDETSIQGNKLAGQPQSNLWFGSYQDLRTWGPASGYGGPWIQDQVRAGTPSDPFLIAGFDRRILHLAIGSRKPVTIKMMRTTDRLPIHDLSAELAVLPRLTIQRGDWRQPAAGFRFEIAKPATVYLSVDGRGKSLLPTSWKLTDLTLKWGRNIQDRIYSRDFPAGQVTVPADAVEHIPGSFTMPHMAFVELSDKPSQQITAAEDTTIVLPDVQKTPDRQPGAPVQVSIQIDRKGDGTWTNWKTVSVPTAGYIHHSLPNDLEACWLRLITDRDCVATAILHQTTARYVDGSAAQNKELFTGLANVNESTTLNALVYPAKRNRNLRIISGDDHVFDFTKTNFEFRREPADKRLRSLLQVKPEFTVDAASVIVKQGSQRLRLPKGDAAFDQPFATGWPRATREVESERHLANIHGTFYELPLVTNGAPPAWNLVRPVSSHSKQISDFCSWNGLLVLCGVRKNAANDGHVFRDPENDVALWFGGIDDLWKFGKPVGKGGPWRNTSVKSGVPSDPYLMKGYDQKIVRISHSSPADVNITLQVDLDGNGLWVDYRTLAVSAGGEVQHRFPEDYSACWIRAVSDLDTQATVQLEYR